MTHLLAEGGYQVFSLGSNEKTWLYFAILCSVAAIAVALLLVRGVLAADQGTASMQEIAKAIQEGAEAFLSRQFKTIGIIVVPLAVLMFFTATTVTHTVGLHTVVDLSRTQAGIYRVICFLAGAICSGLTGFIGMSLAVRGNVRTAAAARDGKMAPALKVAYRTGAITGLLCVGLGLLGATVIVLIFQNTATAVLIGFGFGASLLALFMRVGGGIFTKAADVGADLVGKVGAGRPEDDPRNAATIADNVGDNVGVCAGMAADHFESYAIMIIFPLIIAGMGIIASIIAILSVKARASDKTAMSAINRGYRVAGIVTVIASFCVAQWYVHNLLLFWAVFTGVCLGQVASMITEHFTSTERSPVREIADSARTGPATTVLAGIAVGLESSVWAIMAITVAIAVSIGMARGNIELTLYLVALTGMGLLATTGMVVSEDSFGPVSDNSAGIAEMAGEFGLSL